MICQSRIAAKLSWAALVALAAITLTIAMTMTARADPPCVLGADRVIDGDLGIDANSDYTLTLTHSGLTGDRSVTFGDYAGEPTINTATQTLTNKTLGAGNTVGAGLTWSAAQDLNSQALTNANLDAPDIDGGTMDNTAIGGTTPAAGAFTTGAFGGGYGDTGVSISAAGVIQANGAVTSDGAVTGGTVLAGSLTSGRVVFAGASGLLSDDAGFTFAVDTLTVPKLGAFEATGTIDIQGGYANAGGAPYDGVVDAGGGGNWTTIQAGDDDLDAGEYTMLVKEGTYTEDVTISTDNVYIYFEPNIQLTSTTTISGGNVTLDFGIGCNIVGNISIVGHENQLLFHNGCDLDGIAITGDYNLVDGGGWGTVVDGGVTRSAIYNASNANHNTIKDIAAQTTAGQGNSLNGVQSNGYYASIVRVLVPASDEDAFQFGTGGHTLVEGCVILGADRYAIFWNAPEMRIIGNQVMAAAAGGIYSSTVGDNSLISGNIIDQTAGDPINIPAAVEDVVVVGNRTDGAIVDNSGTSTVTGNDETGW